MEYLILLLFHKQCKEWRLHCVLRRPLFDNVAAMDSGERAPPCNQSEGLGKAEVNARGGEERS